MIEATLYQDFFHSLIEGDRYKGAKLVNQAMNNGSDFITVYEQLFRDALYEVGDWWEKNKISVAEEHLATGVADGLLDLIYPKIVGNERTARKVVIACAEGEYHHVGSKMVSHVFEHAGWKTYFLGANTPVSDLLGFIGTKQPDVLSISMSIFWNMDNLVELVEIVENTYPDLMILLGGQAFRKGGSEIFKHYRNIRYIPDLQTLIKQINQFPPLTEN